MTRAYDVAKTAAQSALGNPHFNYEDKDCQAWVEWCWANPWDWDLNKRGKDGYIKNYSGSNNMYRTACVWVGTKEQCIAKYGLIPIGAMVFKIRKYDPAKCSAKYNDAIGDVYHVGLYCGGIDGVETGHSSNGGSQTAKLSTWGYIGITKDIVYDFGNGTASEPSEPAAPVVPPTTTTPPVTGADAVIVSASSVNLRKTPGGDYIRNIPNGARLNVLERKQQGGKEYGRVRYAWADGKYAGVEYEGWIEMAYVAAANG